MKIEKETHSSLKIPKLLINPKKLTYQVAFTESCRYDIGSEDQGDINKLFGIGYFPFHHFNSVRIGWNYNLQTSKIDIWAYWYKNKNRLNAYLKSIDINTSHYFTIKVEKDKHIIDLGDVVFPIQLKPESIGYLLGPYFGGNQTAPHDIIIDFKKVNI